MAETAAPVGSANAAAEAERFVAWLRLPAVALIALAESLAHPYDEKKAFLIVLALFSAWSAAMFAWVHLRAPTARLALAATGVDIVAIGVLAGLSGGAYSHVRLAYFVVPVAVAFRFRPAITAAAAVVTTGAYVVLAVAHPASHNESHAVRFIVTQAGFLAWVGLACVLLSQLLARRTEVATRLAEARARLLADALTAEQRERKALAEALHDHAMQNLLSMRHELEEAGEAMTHPSLDRADAALAETVGQLREAVFELHPYVLEEAGLEAAVRAVAQRAAARGGFDLRLAVRSGNGHPGDQLVFSAARELLSNVLEHANATHVTVELGDVDGDLRLVVEDDGEGFPRERLAQRLAAGHVGIASQRVRIEAAGGSMDVASTPGSGTRVEVRVPAA